MILSGVFLYFLNLIFLVPLVGGGGREEGGGDNRT